MGGGAFESSWDLWEPCNEPSEVSFLLIWNLETLDWWVSRAPPPPMDPQGDPQSSFLKTVSQFRQFCNSSPG